MAPAVVEAATGAGSAAKEFKKESGTARLLGSGLPDQEIGKSMADLLRLCWDC